MKEALPESPILREPDKKTGSSNKEKPKAVQFSSHKTHEVEADVKKESISAKFELREIQSCQVNENASDKSPMNKGSVEDFAHGD